MGNVGVGLLPMERLVGAMNLWGWLDPYPFGPALLLSCDTLMTSGPKDAYWLMNLGSKSGLWVGFGIFG